MIEKRKVYITMAGEVRKDFCIECRKETEYILKKKNITKVIKDKEYEFNITVAVCAECGEEMSLPGLMDKNIQEIDEQYRLAEGLVSVNDIEKMMKIYKIGKAPLSLALGFGEVTITRYLLGQIPSKEYSDIMKAALTSPTAMKNKLLENKEKIADTAYSKAVKAADELDNLFSVSEKMLRVIAYVFERLEEVTPLMLQKLLYFIQGLSLALRGTPMFKEDCQAWAHGPVYPEVYYLFRDFKYNPIEDARFALFDGATDLLTDDEKEIINLVVNTFGVYGGKALERITHNEQPWKLARRGYGDTIPCNAELSKDSIKEYFRAINEEFSISSESGLNEYIIAMLKK